MNTAMVVRRLRLLWVKRFLLHGVKYPGVRCAVFRLKSMINGVSRMDFSYGTFG